MLLSSRGGWTLERGTAICGTISVSVCLRVRAVDKRPLGRLGFCPTFLALMSDWDHPAGAEEPASHVWVLAPVPAAVWNSALKLFSPPQKKKQDNEEGLINQGQRNLGTTRILAWWVGLGFTNENPAGFLGLMMKHGQNAKWISILSFTFHQINHFTGGSKTTTWNRGMEALLFQRRKAQWPCGRVCDRKVVSSKSYQRL